MKGLLQKEAPKRLGYGASGSADVRSHPFFKPVNWGKLERREVGRCIQERCSSGGEDEWGGGGERSRERMCTPAHVAAPAYRDELRRLGRADQPRIGEVPIPKCFRHVAAATMRASPPWPGTRSPPRPAPRNDMARTSPASPGMPQ